VSKALSSWFGFSLCILGYFCATNNPALAEARLALDDETLSFRTPSLLAQVTSDDTVNTQVTENGNTAEITGGETRGDNLFHSFQDFSVGTGNEASFLNANDISNIFSRVTGGEISNIDGLISANGSANLFLINPAGIIFGEGARLDIGGSFYGSSASSILFEDGEFSATDLDNPPLLTVNAPIGLNFRDDPQSITNQSVADGVGLQVDAGKSINLVGGDLNFVGGILTVPAGNVQLGGLSTSGTVGITNEGNLSFPDEVSRGNVSLTQGAFIDVAGTRGGEIELTAADIQITGGSVLQGGTFADVGLADSQSGNINLNATGAIDVNGSRIDNLVGIGNAGAIEINATSFSLINDGTVINSTFGQGNAGNITINATEDVSLDTGDIFSNVGSRSASQAEGNAGEIAIDANSISLTNGAQIQSSVFQGGLGNGNNVTLNARGGDVTISSSNQGRSGIFTDVETIDNFAAGNIKIDAQGSILLNNAVIRNANAGTGFAGDINLNTPNEVSIKDSTIAANGNSGRIFIGNTVEPSQVTLEGERTEIETEDGTSFDFSNELITTSFNPNDLLERISINAGDRINIIGTDIQSSAATTRLDRDSADPEQLNNNFSTIALTVDGENPLGNISLKRSRINTSNSSTGFAGDINLNARNEISIKDSQLFAEGNLGRIAIGNTVESSQVTLEGERTEIETEDGANFEFSNTLSTASSNPDDLLGSISINARDRINITGTDIQSSAATTRLDRGPENPDQENFSRIALTVDEENSLGNISVERSRINTTNSNLGFAGDINLNARAEIEIISTSIFSTGQLGRIAIGQSEISGATSSPQAINFNDSFVTVSNENVTAPETENQQLDAGRISINAINNISLINNSQIRSVTERFGNAGNVTVQAENGNVSFDNSNVFSNVQAEGIGFAGDINITANSISLLNGSQLQSSTIGFGDGGNITLNARENIALSGRSPSDNLASAIFTDSNALGNAGNIQVNVTDGSLSLSDEATLNTESAGLGDAGESNAGEITIDVDLVSLDGNSTISAQAFDDANGGNLKIDANYIIAFPSNGTGNDLVAAAAAGNGGNINLTVEQIFGLEIGTAIDDQGNFISNNDNDIDASSGNPDLNGTVNINTSDINPVQGATELPSNVVEPEQTAAQTCEAGRGTTQSSFAIAGKGGVPPAPDAPLNSENIITSAQSPAASTIPQPIETSQGKIQPARGIKVTKSGKIVLTAYRTNSAGERIPEIRPNCNSY
jgi:filamentous hemagglutinin family protein